MTSSSAFERFRLETLADGVYAALGKREEGCDILNVGVVDLGESVLIFDAFMVPQTARELLGAIDQLIGKPVSALVYSHFHFDHTVGSAVFPQETTIISSHSTRELMLSGDPFGSLEGAKGFLPRFIAGLTQELDNTQDETVRRDIIGTRGAYTALQREIDNLTLRLPEITFKEELAIHDSHRVVEVKAYDGGHSKGDTILYLPDERIVFVGDLVPIGRHPYLPGGDLLGWDAALEEIEAFNVAVVVGGHGRVGTQEDIRAMRRYFAALEQQAREIISAGGNAEDAAAVPTPPEYQAWLGGEFRDNLQVVVEWILARQDE